MSKIKVISNPYEKHISYSRWDEAGKDKRTVPVSLAFLFVILSLSGCGAAGVSRDVEVTQEMVDDALPGIVCWGDSLTAGYLGEGVNYPDELSKMIDERMMEPIRERSGNASLMCPEVVNLGVSTETTLEIGGRNGGIPLIAAADFTIPGEEREIDFVYCSSVNDETTKLQRQEGGGVTSVTVDGVEGTLIRWYDVEADYSKYKFKRYKAGDNVDVHYGDIVTTNLYDMYLDYIPIIMMGSNGIWDSSEELMSQCKALVDHSESDAYIVAPMALNLEPDQDKMDQIDAKAVAYFGSHAISMRRWMMENGLETAGLEPTEEDRIRIEAGQMPASIMNEDMVHFTPEGYRVMAEMYYEKLDELGYFEGLKALMK